MGTNILIIPFILGLPIIVCVILLQIYLSNKQEQKLGLILPCITLAISLLIVISMLLFMVTPMDGKSAVFNTIGTVIYVFIVVNIPTLILMIIYWVCKDNQKKKKNRYSEENIKKMNLKDL